MRNDHLSRWQDFVSFLARATSKELVERMLNLLVENKISMVIKFEITKKDGGISTYYVRTNGIPELVDERNEGKPHLVDLIVRITRFDLARLLGGRMSWEDAWVTERLKVSGDLRNIFAFKKAIQGRRS